MYRSTHLVKKSKNKVVSDRNEDVEVHVADESKRHNRESKRRGKIKMFELPW